MAGLQQLIRYQRDCYEADNREVGIKDLLHSKIRHLRFLEDEEVALSGTIERVPLPEKYGEKLRKDAFKYRRDKTLVYAALPVVGKHSELEQFTKHLCAPLVNFPAEIVELKGKYFVAPDLSDCRINLPVLLEIAEAAEIESGTVLNALGRLPSAPWPKSRLHDVAALFADLLPHVDFGSLAGFPQLMPGKEVRQRRESEEQSLCCLPSTAIALLANSPDTRGVLFELAELSEQEKHSAPLQTLFDAKPPELKETKTLPSLAPSTLSEAQEQVARLCRHQDVTMVVGPPGTGKSHTIASVALDHLARKQTVLIASRMDQAVNVVGDKIEEMIGDSGAVVRAGRKQHLRKLKESLENLLSGIGGKDQEAEPAKHLFRQLRKLDKELQRLEQSITRNQSREIAWGQSEVSTSSGIFGGLSKRLTQGLRQWQLGDFDGWQSLQSYTQLLEQRTELSKRFLQQTLEERTNNLLDRKRSDLTHFLQAIKARSDGRQRELFQKIDFRSLLHAFPVWLCKLTDLANVLPLQEDLFDLAILDEATQCDIASCLPLLQRAKRVVIVGDPKQLRHISFLSEGRQLSIATSQNLDEAQQQRFHFRKNSILDATQQAVMQAQVVFLNEHFRSLPPIIEFSNGEFYQGALRVMRQRPLEKQDVLQSVRTEGVRSSTGRNELEAEKILRQVQQLVEGERAVLPQTAQSVGILSPFRSQVDYLARELDKRFSYEEFEKHNLLVGTAHTFQGEERDLMLLSLVVDNESHSASFRFLEQPEVLNVSITRARHRQEIYRSFDLDQLPSGSLLRRWLEACDKTRMEEHLDAPRVQDEFRSEVLKCCNARGFRCWQDFKLAGLELDLLVENSGQLAGIDLVGYPGALMQAYSLERYRVLYRSGLQVFPLSYRLWTQDRERCLERIEKQLAR